MLNIQNRISLSKDSKKRIKKFIKSKGTLDSISWSAINIKVKNDLSKKLLFNQKLKCAYCQRYIYSTLRQIDHFADKSTYPQFTFTATNLFYSCGRCNSSGVKGKKNTVHTLNVRYDRTVFNILHPYYDDVDVEIIYRDADKITYNKPLCSGKGLATIAFFEFDELPMSIFRSTTLLYERRNPLLSAQEKELIQKGIAYKS